VLGGEAGPPSLNFGVVLLDLILEICTSGFLYSFQIHLLLRF
jgi:hypothetical protein